MLSIAAGDLGTAERTVRKMTWTIDGRTRALRRVTDVVA